MEQQDGAQRALTPGEHDGPAVDLHVQGSEQAEPGPGGEHSQNVMQWGRPGNVCLFIGEPEGGARSLFGQLGRADSG
ncbi:hypothetical protein JCM4814A_25780 [Streptomyces phaeofaciens JCM 4814]|uniref:Uncharacterized protein n=1 Tax=Streptomyces phaeofaciens TaxID=68254 RepID=A0A918LQR1_9ACTN|nr:hypothetical protein GCM10010226_11110 [Streptomyces phaeofaciens]